MTPLPPAARLPEASRRTSIAQMLERARTARSNSIAHDRNPGFGQADPYLGAEGMGIRGGSLDDEEAAQRTFDRIFHMRPEVGRLGDARWQGRRRRPVRAQQQRV